MADASSPSPYAPGIISDERLPPRPPGRAVPFLVATFVTTLVTGGLWQLKYESGDAATFQSRLIGRVDLIPQVRDLAGLPILLWAYLSDRVPLWGTRRDGYVALATVMIGLAWLIVAATGQPLVWLAVAAPVGLARAFSDAAIAGALAEIGRRRAATGLLASAHVPLLELGGLGLVPASLLIATTPIWLPAGIAAGLTLAVVLLIVMRSDHAAPPPGWSPEPAPSIPRFLRSRACWVAIVLLGCAGLATVPQTPVWPVSRAARSDTLGQWMNAWTAFAFMSAAVLAYVVSCRRLSFGKLLPVVLLLNAGTLAIQALTAGDDAATPNLVLNIRAAGGGLAAAASLDLVLRAAPRGREAFGVIFLMRLPSMLTAFGQAVVITHAKASVRGTAWFAAAAAIAATMAALLLPREIKKGRDGRVVGSPS